MDRDTVRDYLVADGVAWPRLSEATRGRILDLIRLDRD